MSDSAQNEARSEKKSNKAVIILIALLALLVVLLIVVIILLLGRGGKESVNENTPVEQPRAVTQDVRTVVDEESAQTVMEQMRKEVEEGMFECQMSMTWNFVDGKSESNDAYVANSTNNTHPLYFDVYIKDTDELLYKSPVLPVGTDLKNIKLDRELPAGKYEATVMYTLLKDEESQEEISGAGFVITINVLN